MVVSLVVLVILHLRNGVFSVTPECETVLEEWDVVQRWSRNEATVRS